MPTATTSEEFLDYVTASGLIEPARLEPYAQQLLQNGPTHHSPHAMAKRIVQDGLLTPFQAQQLLLGRHKNFFVGKYKLLEPLGSGGMGKVFLCEHSVMRHRVAMKMIARKKREDSAQLARFMREARAVAALDHPNIVRAHDFDCSGEKYYYIVMEYVDGVSLHDLTYKRGPLDPTHAAHYLAQAVDGLQHIHKAGLIHRDLKPANLLLDRNGTIKILDLGLARFEEDDDHITERFNDTSLLGTADFVAPEQSLLGAQVDVRSDIYCLGCTFYFLLTGRVPFDDNTIMQKLIGHQQREPKPVTDMRQDVPKALLEILNKMMAKRPGDRYQTPADLKKVLAPWAGLVIPLPTERELPRLSKASQPPRSSPSTGSGRAMMTPRPKSAAPIKPKPAAVPAAVPKKPNWRTLAVVGAIAAVTMIAALMMVL